MAVWYIFFFIAPTIALGITLPSFAALPSSLTNDVVTAM
jgi:hypothetical protein